MTLDFSRADKLWESNTSHEKRQNGVVRAQPSAATATLATHKASHEEWRSRMAELDYRKAIGELVPRDQVEKDAEAAARRARQRLELIPERLSGLISIEAYHELRKEIRIACGELAADGTS